MLYVRTISLASRVLYKKNCSSGPMMPAHPLVTPPWMRTGSSGVRLQTKLAPYHRIAASA